MSDVVLEFNHVWKKFRKGERATSLRDFIPAMTKKLFNGNQKEELQEKEFWSVKDVFFQVKRGESLGIIGPNGAGKSTILKLLSKILKPNKGDIRVDGRLSALIEVGAGFHQDLTGRENIYLNAAILGMKKDEVNKKFDEIVEFSELEEFIDTPVKRYSSGMYARLGFSVAAYVDPEIILIDEILSVGDLRFQQKCFNKMEKFKANGVAIIFISHNISAISRLCDNVILLNKGECLIQDIPSKVIAMYLDNDFKGKFLSYYNIKILKSEFINSGTNHYTAIPHEKVELLIQITSKELITQYNIGFAVISDQTGGSIFSIGAIQTGATLPEINPGQLINVSISFYAHLCKGEYSIVMEIYDNKDNKILFSDKRIATLMIFENESWRGIAHLGAEFRIS